MGVVRLARGFTMRRGWGLAAVLILAATPAAAQESDYGRLFESLWSTVNENFYDPHFRGADWVAIGERHRPRVRDVRTDEGFATLAAEMLAEVPSSHLSIRRPAGATGTTGIGARTERLEGQSIVVEVAPLSDAWRQGLRPGDRLLTAEAMAGALGSQANLTVESCAGGRREVAVRRESAFWPPEHPGFRWRQIRSAPDQRIGYIRIDRFDDGAAELADRAMSELKNASALVIDLRNNSGGNTSGLRLASYFGPGAEPAVVLLARPWLAALGRPPTPADIAAAPRVEGAYTDEAVFTAVSTHNGAAAFWTEAVDPRFERPVFLLIGPETASAAEGFAWYMRLRTPAVLIGRTSAGALLSSDTLDIGDGWRVTLPAHGLWGPDGRDYGDEAVEPHVTTAWTRADLCAGRDPDLEEALRRAEAPAG
jgi:carboxyl-terminal processing protease